MLYLLYALVQDTFIKRYPVRNLAFLVRYPARHLAYLIRYPIRILQDSKDKRRLAYLVR